MSCLNERLSMYFASHWGFQFTLLYCCTRLLLQNSAWSCFLCKCVRVCVLEESGSTLTLEQQNRKSAPQRKLNPLHLPFRVLLLVFRPLNPPHLFFFTVFPSFQQTWFHVWIHVIWALIWAAAKTMKTFFFFIYHWTPFIWLNSRCAAAHLGAVEDRRMHCSLRHQILPPPVAYGTHFTQRIKNTWQFGTEPKWD